MPDPNMLSALNGEPNPDSEAWERLGESEFVGNKTEKLKQPEDLKNGAELKKYCEISGVSKDILDNYGFAYVSELLFEGDEKVYEIDADKDRIEISSGRAYKNGDEIRNSAYQTIIRANQEHGGITIEQRSIYESEFGKVDDRQTAISQSEECRLFDAEGVEQRRELFKYKPQYSDFASLSRGRLNFPNYNEDAKRPSFGGFNIFPREHHKAIQTTILTRNPDGKTMRVYEKRDDEEDALEFNANYNTEYNQNRTVLLPEQQSITSAWAEKKQTQGNTN